MRQTDYVVLGLLSESPMTGYQIKKIIDVRFSFFWNESYGQLYPSLKSLKERGLIDEVTEVSARNRSRKSFTITPSGMEELKNWLRQPVEHETVRLGILLKMYFSNLAEDDVIINHLLQFKAEHENNLSTLQQFQTELKPIARHHANHERVLQVIDFGIKTNEAYLAWCSETIESLKAGGEI